MDERLTDITAIPDDAAFERAIFMLRLAHQLSDINRTRSLHWKTKALSQCFQKFAAVLFRLFLCYCDLFFRSSESFVKCLYALGRHLRIVRDP